MNPVARWMGKRLSRYLARARHVHGASAPADLPQLRACLRPGDVLLVEGHSRVSTAIKYLTQSTWSHAALYVGDALGRNDAQGEPLCFVEADIVEGVRAVALAEYRGLHARVCRPASLSADEIGRVVAYAVGCIGHRYDLRNVIDLARYLLPTPPVPSRWRRRLLALGSGDPTRAICSTLIAQAFQSVHYPILPIIEQRPAGDLLCPACVDEILHVRHHSLFVPRDFDVSPYFEVVKPTLAAGFDHHRLRWQDPAASALSTAVPQGASAMIRIVQRLLATGAALAALHAGPVLAASLNGFDLSGALIPESAIERGGPPKDGIPAIDHPRFIPAREARLAADDRVLGVVHKGVARAYPVRILNWHEVVNDRLAGDPLIVTYCPLCGTGVAFDGRIGGREFTFGVSGLLYNSDVLLYDRASQSLWSQILQMAVTGPMKGRRLSAVPLAHTSWSDWRRRQPDTEVLSTDTGFERDYARDPYAGYDKVQRLMFDVQHRDERLPLKEWVLGITIGSVAKAYPFGALASRVDAAGVLRDRVGGQEIEIRFSREHRSAQAFDRAGQPLAGVMAYWFAWVAFHPRTEVLPDR